MNRTLSSQTLAELRAGGAAVLLLDVRRSADFAADPQIIPGAGRYDPTRIDEWAAGLPQDRSIVLYCARGGSVSNGVLDRLLAEGLQARYLEGGIEAWKKAGGETVSVPSKNESRSRP